jgi:hypothetical protein
MRTDTACGVKNIHATCVCQINIAFENLHALEATAQQGIGQSLLGLKQHENVQECRPCKACTNCSSSLQTSCHKQLFET